MELFKSVANWASYPPVMFTGMVGVFFFVFPPSDWFLKWNRRLKLDLLWTTGGGIVIFAALTLFLALGWTDPNFRHIVSKPDNVPIVALIYLSLFYLWLAMKQARVNDLRVEEGLKPTEFSEPKDKVLVWPDLVFVEFIALIIVSIILVVWSLSIEAPLEGPANPTVSPNPSKAPWYFLALQEMLVYFDPWIAGVILPTLIGVGLIAIPYIDNNPEGAGYYSFRNRKMAISIFLFCWLVLWVFLINVGTFLRGPDWNFFGPFEPWDVHKLVPLTNVNLSEYVYVKWLDWGLPRNILLREIWGILLVGVYFVVLPPLLAKTTFKKLYGQVGNLRYSVFIILLLCAVALPIKMYLRWVFNLKYIVAIPEYFLNI